MRPEKSDQGWLWDMLDSSKAVIDLVQGTCFQGYQQDRRTRRAVEREVEIIGEAARNISEAFRQSRGAKSSRNATSSPTSTRRSKMRFSGKWPRCMFPN